MTPKRLADLLYAGGVTNRKYEEMGQPDLYALENICRLMAGDSEAVRAIDAAVGRMAELHAARLSRAEAAIGALARDATGGGDDADERLIDEWTEVPIFDGPEPTPLRRADGGTA